MTIKILGTAYSKMESLGDTARRANAIRCALAALLLCAECNAQTLALPPRPPVSKAGLSLILSFEVGDDTGAYYKRYLIHPEWPGASSGPTVGIGYDLGYNSSKVIRDDWREHPDVDRLAAVAGITGQRARSITSSLRDISTPWPLAQDVFSDVTLARFWALCRRTWPGFDDLRPNAQSALLSLTFNRGSSMAGGNRKEMRAIQGLTKKKDYEGIAQQILDMRRIWRGTDVGAGLIRRREAEAKLVLQP